MTYVEQMIENAIFAIEQGKTFEEWIESEPNKDYVKSDPKEIWEIAKTLTS